MRDANKRIEALADINFSKNLPKSYEPKFDPNRLHEILADKTPDEIQAMNVLFEERYGTTLEEYLGKNSFVPIGSLDNYVQEATDAIAAKENFESDVQKVDPDKIAKVAEELRNGINDIEEVPMSVWLKSPGDTAAEKALLYLTPAELEALKRHWEEE